MVLKLRSSALALAFFCLTSHAGATLLAGWDFQTTTNGGTAAAAAPSSPKVFVANVGTGTLYLDGANGSSNNWVTAASGNELTSFGGSNVNTSGTSFSTVTTGTSALAIQATTANGKYAVFKFSMTGYKDLVVSYATQRTATGFTSHVWEYSTDGSSWTSSQTATISATSFATTTLSTITGLDNVSNAYLRLSLSGGTGGNNRFDNIQFNTTAIPASYTISFDNNGGIGTMSDQTINSGASANLTSNSFTKAGNTFAGWATTAGGTVAYTDGASYTMGTANVTLYAVWTPSTPSCPASAAVTPSADQARCVGIAANQLTANITSAAGTGTPTLLYKWYYNTTNSNTVSGATDAGATGNTFTPPTTATEAGTARYYFCVGYATDNTCGQTNATQSLASNTVKVTVNAVPSDPTGSIAVSANPSCGAASLSYTTGYYWETSISDFTITGRATSSDYSLTATGTMYVRAYNGNCWSTNTINTGTVTVNEAIVIDAATPANQSAYATAAAVFSVTVTGGTVSGHQWQVSTNNGANWNDVSTGTGGTTASYTTPVTTTGMSGYLYRCIVKGTNPCANITSNPAALTVTQALWANPITGTNPNTSNPYTTGDVVGYANVSVSGIGRGTGISGSNANDRYNAANFSTTLGAAKYFSFVLTPVSGYEINFTNFSFTGASSAGTPSIELRSSLDNYTTAIGGVSSAYTGTTISLSGAAYQHIQVPIEFRLYFYGTGVLNGTNISVNDFAFNGSVTTGIPQVNLSINTATGSEAATTAITLTGTSVFAVAGNQTVSVALSGTGLTNADFTGVTFPATLTIPSGSTTGTVTFNINNDFVAEGDETATFTIGSPSAGVTLGSAISKTLDITDNPSTAIILNAVNVAATENFGGMSTTAAAAIPTGFGIQDGNTTTITTATTAQASSGTPTAGAAYNWGQTTSDRALGLMFSSGYNNKSIIATIKNNTGSAGTVFQLSFNYEQYRSNSSTQTFKLQYSTSLTTGWVDVTDGGFTNIANGSTHGFTPLVVSQSITNLQYSPTVAVPNGGVVYFRWILSGTTNSAGVGIDDFSIALVTTNCTAPATQAKDIIFANVEQSTMDISWTTGNGDNKVVYMNSSNSFTAPTDGAILGSTNTAWQNSGQQLIYNGAGNTVSVSSLTAGATYHFRVYEYNCTSLNTKFNTGAGATANPNSQITDPATTSASVIQAVSGSEANTISSLTNGAITTNANGTQVWQFKLYDGNGTNDDADYLSTIYKTWTIRPGTGNTVADWSTVIDNVKFFIDGSATPVGVGVLVNSNTIAVSSIAGISVPDGEVKTISMRITLKSPMAVGSDGKYLVFKIDNSDVTVDANTASSQLGTFSSASSSSTKNQIEVLATLQFINAPAAVVLGNNFSVTVSAVDANGNIDQDQTTAITLSKFSGAGTLTGNGTQNLAAGTYTFAGLTYNQVGAFQLKAEGGSFAPIYATIVSANDPFQVFDDFNRTSDIVGTPSGNTGGAAWTEISTSGDDGSRIRTESNDILVLSNCNSNQSGQSTNGMQQLLYNVEDKYETVYDNVSSPLNWEFNMRAHRTLALSGFDANNYAAGVILGCNKPDVTDATASGYAVTIGAPGATDFVRLIKFTTGLTLNSHVTEIVASTFSGEQDFYSVKVSYNPCTDTWSLSVRSDAGSFVAPNTGGAYATAVTGTDNSYSNLDLKYFGAVWKHANSCTEYAQFDNFFIPNSATVVAGTKTWNGSVNTAWNEPNNWGPCPGVPTATDNVIIPVTGTNPVISATPAGICKNLTVNANAGLTINAGQFLNVWGNVLNNGSADFGAGTLSIEGTGSATVTGTIAVANVDIDKNVTVNAGAVLNIINSLDLQSGTLTNNGSVTLKSDANGTAYLDNFSDSNNGTYSGDLTVERYVGGTVVTGIHYISFPFINGNYDLASAEFTAQMGALGGDGNIIPTATCDWYQTASNSPYSKIMQWNENTVFSGCSQKGWYARNSGYTEAGRGYAATLNNTQTLSLTGLPNLSDYGYPVTNSNYTVANPAAQGIYNPQYTTTSSGVILTGNPFPSPYMWDGGDADIDNQAYVWQTTGTFRGSYQPITPGTVLSIGQGFFIKTITNPSPNPSLIFTNANRKTNHNPAFYQTNNGSSLDITVSGNGYADRTQIIFNDQATTAYDGEFDGFKMMSNYTQPTLYTVMNGQQMACINTLPSIELSPNVVMGMFAGASGTYTFTFNNLSSFDPTSYITLEDKKLNIFYDVRSGDYSFSSDVADDWDRFVIHFTPAAEIAAIDQNCEAPGSISIEQPGVAQWQYAVADGSGNTISSGTLNQSTPVTVTAPAGTYTLTLTDANNYTVMKNIIVNGTQGIAAVFSSSSSNVETGETVTLTSTGNAVSYNWDMGDGTIINNQSSVINHQYTTAGTYTVTLTVTNADGCTSTTTQTITVTEKVVSGVSPVTNHQSPIAIWSSENSVFIDFSRQTKVEAEIQIYNVLGQQLVNEKFGRSTIYTKPLANLEAAYVIVRVKNEDSITTKRVFIINK